MKKLRLTSLSLGMAIWMSTKTTRLGRGTSNGLQPSQFPPSRMCRAFRDAFRVERNKPTLIDVDFVRDWSSSLKPSLEAVDLGHLANSASSGMAQYGYLILKNQDEEAVMTYSAKACQKERYPRTLNTGETHISENGAGVVSSTTFSPATGLWTTTVDYAYGYSDSIELPVEPIPMSPSSALPFSPLAEQMRPDWPSKVEAIKRNLTSAPQLWSAWMFSLLKGSKKNGLGGLTFRRRRFGVPWPGRTAFGFNGRFQCRSRLPCLAPQSHPCRLLSLRPLLDTTR